MIVDFIDHQKLEKVEMGGHMARWYGTIVEEMFLEFSKDLEKMSSISYDPLEMLNAESNAQFKIDYDTHMAITKNIDNRLATISKICFESSNDLMALQKVNCRSSNFDSIKIPNYTILKNI